MSWQAAYKDLKESSEEEKAAMARNFAAERAALEQRFADEVAALQRAAQQAAEAAARELQEAQDRYARERDGLIRAHDDEVRVSPIPRTLPSALLT